MKNKIIKRIITFVLTTMLTLTTTPVATMPVYAQGEPVTPTNTVTLSPSVGILRVPAIGDVVINDTNFPNANFRAWICSTYGKNDGDTLTATTIAAIININVSNNDIADLTGIEHFTALTTLNCSYNHCLLALPLLSGGADGSPRDSLWCLETYSKKYNNKKGILLE